MSEASYAYILSGQKFIKNAKNSQFKNLKLAVIQCYQLGEFGMVENDKIEKFKWDILGDFQTMWDFSNKIQDDHHGGFELGHAPLKHFQNDKRAQIELKKQLN